MEVGISVGNVMRSKKLKAIVGSWQLKSETRRQGDSSKITQRILINKETLRGSGSTHLLNSASQLTLPAGRNGASTHNEWRKCTFNGARNLIAKTASATMFEEMTKF